MGKTSEAQKRATQAYRAKNREKTKIQSAKSAAKTFITKYGSLDDLNELDGLLQKRKAELEKE